MKSKVTEHLTVIPKDKKNNIKTFKYRLWTETISLNSHNVEHEYNKSVLNHICCFRKKQIGRKKPVTQYGISRNEKHRVGVLFNGVHCVTFSNVNTNLNKRPTRKGKTNIFSETSF